MIEREELINKIKSLVPTNSPMRENIINDINTTISGELCQYVLDSGMIVDGRFNLNELNTITDLAEHIRKGETKETSTGWWMVRKDRDDPNLRIYRELGQIRNWKIKKAKNK